MSLKVEHPSNSDHINHFDKTKTALRSQLLLTLKKRDIIDNLIKSYTEVLEAELGSTKAGLELNLINPEGYPIADVNHSSCRNSRKQIAILKNDRNGLMTNMENMLFEYHAVVKQANEIRENGNTTIEAQNTKNLKNSKNSKNFEQVENNGSDCILEITDVTTGATPAFESGLQKGDKIIKFGDIQKANFLGLNQIASFVKTSQGQQITIAFYRNSSDIQFTIIKPRVWRGKGIGYFGLLGCALHPI